MNAGTMRWSVAVALAGAVAAPAVCQAQDAQRALPTLLIKGEVVSVDTTDAAAALLKVKDRYGFETPIYLTPETKIAQGDQTLTQADLATGTMVEVEYNFDINTAKRHAVNVNVSKPAETAAPAAPEPAASSAAPAVESAAPAIPAPSTSSLEQAPAEPSTATSTPAEQPAGTATP